MGLELNTLVKTTHNKYAGVIRIFLGGMFLTTGIMKLTIPLLAAAFAGQLQSAGIPFHEFNIWFVPVFEVFVGVLLFIGLMSRLGALVAIGLMVVATYVHVVVDDPSLFPLQPEQPIIPIVVIVLSGIMIASFNDRMNGRFCLTRQEHEGFSCA